MTSQKLSSEFTITPYGEQMFKKNNGFMKFPINELRVHQTKNLVFTTIKIRKMFHEIPNLKLTKTLGEQTTKIRNNISYLTFGVF